jgi:hypothetical protein
MFNNEIENTIGNQNNLQSVASAIPVSNNFAGRKDTLTQASSNWLSRPDDERFTNLIDLRNFKREQKHKSRQGVVSSKGLRAEPDSNDLEYKGLKIIAERTGQEISPTHWSFGQLATLGGAPAGYLRKLPAPLAADCLNFGLKIARDVEDVGVLVELDSDNQTPKTLRAATGPKYGRIWDADIAESLVSEFGDGVNGRFKVPGIFGKPLSEVTKENTTLYASDRDMFVFLADEENRIAVDNRREGKPGELSRGFFVWNSEVGDKTIGAAFFLFDYVCGNRIVWGVEEFKEIRLKHTVSAPDKWLHEITPILTQYANSSAAPVEAMIKAAQQKKVDDIESFLFNRFGKRDAGLYIEAHHQDESRGMESLWDISTGMTAYARRLTNTDARVAVEREAGKILAMAA